MNPERWQKVKDVLAEAMEVNPVDREACLDRRCAGDASLRREVQILLDHESGAGSRFLNETALSEVSVTLLAAEQAPVIGRQFGAYKTVKQIGLGGMGEVYRAYRADDEYRKEVALKVVRGGQDSEFVVTRFKKERQILAGLEHPNIARLLDGGTSEDDTPYLVMELVDGQPITDYCDSNALSTHDRLKIFMEVCTAVQYAHQRLIIHRDIKPSNILVTRDGTPKLLDFGIAKILDTDAGSAKPDQTLTIFRALTPQYASPEQVTGEAITTASDVYSLGAVLYELLAGTSPYPNTTNYQDAARMVCEFEPCKPSTVPRLNGKSTLELKSGFSAKTLSFASDRRRNDLKGDLDNIVLMALRKEPQRRYASVEQFAEDIRRYLANLPVMARKDTASYRASKFVLRHKVGLAAATAIVLTVIAGFVITVREARLAQQRFNDVRSLANSLIFDVHDSIKDLPGSTPAKKIIVDRALRYLNNLAQQSGGDVGLQRELASAYERLGSVQGDYLENNLGDAQGALESYKKALEIRERTDAVSKDWNDRLALATGYRLVAHQLWANGDPRGAREPIQRAIAISEALNLAQPGIRKIVDEVGFEYEVSGRIGYPGDLSAKQKILADYRRGMDLGEIAIKLAPDDIRTLHNLAMGAGDIGNILEGFDAREALKYYQREMEIDSQITQRSNDLRYWRSLAIDYGSIASVYDDLGDYSHALENNKKDLKIYQTLLEKDPNNALLKQGLSITYMNTAASAARAGNIPVALDDSSQSLEIMRKLVANAPEKAFQRGIFAAMLVVRGTILTIANQPESAIAEIQHGRSIYESLYKAGAGEQVNVAAADVKLGEACSKASHDEVASEYFRQALTIAEPLIPANLDAIYVAADAHSGLGDLSARKAQRAGQSASRRSDWGEARSQYQESLNAWHRIEHPNHTAPNSFQVGDPAIVAKRLRLAESTYSASANSSTRFAKGGASEP